MFKIWNVYRRNTINYMVILLKVLLFFPVQLGMKKVKKTTNIFLNFKKLNKEKSCVRKILKSDGTITVTNQSLQREQSSTLIFLDDLKDFPTLTEKTLLQLQLSTPFQVLQLSKWPVVMCHQSLSSLLNRSTRPLNSKNKLNLLLHKNYQTSTEV